MISEEADFYLYTNEFGLEILQLNTSIRSLYINFTYKSPYDICNIQKYIKQYVQIAQKYNSKKIIISENLGSIWNSKICLLEDVSNFPYDYKYIFWIDVGINKKTNFTGLQIPYQKRVEKIFETHPQFLFELNEIQYLSGKEYEPLKELDPNFANVVIGGFFGGRRESIKKTKEFFFKVHDLYLSQGKNVVREENVFNALFMYYPDYFMGLYIKSKCYKWDGGISFVSNINRCELNNQLIFTRVENNKFVLKKENLGRWL